MSRMKPFPIGHFSKSDTFKSLKSGSGYFRRGATYRVIKEFTDFDSDTHPVGETWTAMGFSFSPYHEGSSYYVTNPDGEYHIRLSGLDDEQKEIVDNLENYIQAMDQDIEDISKEEIGEELVKLIKNYESTLLKGFDTQEILDNIEEDDLELAFEEFFLELNQLNIKLPLNNEIWTNYAKNLSLDQGGILEDNFFETLTQYLNK